MPENTHGLNLTPEESKEFEERLKQTLTRLELDHLVRKQKCIEELIAEYKPCTIPDVLKNPLVPFRTSAREIFNDMFYGKLLPGKTPLRKALLADLGTIVSFGFFTVPHELMHAGMNIVTGRGNKEIVINKLFGGDLYHWLIPSIESKLLLPFIGGYVQPESQEIHLANIAVSLAPYVLTPVGIYLVQEGKKKKSIPCAIAGSGLVAGHIGGVIGDFFNAGYTLVHETTLFTAQAMGYTAEQCQNNDLLKFGIVVGGLYVGSRIMSFTYRLAKAGVNHIRNKNQPAQQTTS